jgi:hypothetical protein
MTTSEIIHDKTVIGTEKVDASLKAPVNNIVKTHSTPSDMVNKDKAKIEADKVAGMTKDAHVKVAVETKQNSPVKDRS